MEENQVLETFKRQSIITLEQLVRMQNCSAITARRRLKKWQTYTSINHNGRYYTLPQVPVFDGNGLWQYQGVLFSKHGNLKETIIALITGSPKGLNGLEIAELVGIAQNSSFLSQFKNVPGITREKLKGRFVYFSEQPGIYKRQKQRWEVSSPTDAQAVAVLVQLIKHPKADVQQLAAYVSEQGVSLEPVVIKEFLKSHGLLKKTSNIRR
jgi:hypothetical protein